MGKLNMKAMNAAQAREAERGGNAQYDKLVQGKNVRRLLWPKGDKESFYSEGYVHFGLGEDGKTMVTCPKTFDSHNRCPVCEYVEQLQKSKDKDDKKMADDIKARRRIYVNVINRDSDDEEDTPKVLPIGVTILKGLLDIICDPDYGDITDYNEGRDLTIKRTGQGLKTEYSVIAKPNTSVASESMSEEELEEKMPDLDAMFREKTYEELEDILNGGDGSTEEDDDEEESDEDEELEYDDMELSELKALCKERGISLPAKVSKIKLITLLTKYDEEAESEAESEEDDDEEESDDTDDADDVKDAIAKAIAKRRKK